MTCRSPYARLSRRVVVAFCLGLAVGCGGGGGGTTIPPPPGGGGGGGGGGGETPPIPTPNSIDFTIDTAALASSVMYTDEFFSENGCAYVEGVITATGIRRLLRFSTVVINYGDIDAHIGRPQSPVPPLTSADFVWSGCHGHFHFEGWSNYELRDAQDQVVAIGHKQAFCLLDSIDYTHTKPSGGYDCENQGLTAGHGDLYDRALDGQWVDITGLPEGDYTLHVSVNASNKVIEATNAHPNQVSVPVHVPNPGLPLR